MENRMMRRTKPRTINGCRQGKIAYNKHGIKLNRGNHSGPKEKGYIRHPQDNE